jgi:hypothetical protein
MTGNFYRNWPISGKSDLSSTRRQAVAWALARGNFEPERLQQISTGGTSLCLGLISISPSAKKKSTA